MSSQPRRHTFFLPVGEGQRLCVFHPPRGHSRGQVLHVAPWAEEMNKTRRMAALQAQAMADAGYAVLQIDLLGTGDSSGDFGDASWEAWIEDLLAAHRWLQAKAEGPTWFWGLRAGCLLACEAAQRLAEPVNYLFWQPMPAGKTMLQQFLRLKVAGEMLEGNRGGGIESIRQALAQGQTQEIAGYLLSPALAAGLDASQLRPPALPGRLELIELSTRPEAALTPVSNKLLEQWQTAGHQARGRVVTGPAFWQTTEIEDAPALLSASLAAMDEEVAQ